MRKRFFDDRVYYDKKNDQIWIGRPDMRIQGQPWDFWFTNGKQFMRRSGGPPKNFVEIARENEMELC